MSFRGHASSSQCDCVFHHPPRPVCFFESSFFRREGRLEIYTTPRSSRLCTSFVAQTRCISPRLPLSGSTVATMVSSFTSGSDSCFAEILRSRSRAGFLPDIQFQQMQLYSCRFRAWVASSQSSGTHFSFGGRAIASRAACEPLRHSGKTPLPFSRLLQRSSSLRVENLYGWGCSILSNISGSAGFRGFFPRFEFLLSLPLSLLPSVIRSQ